MIAQLFPDSVHTVSDWSRTEPLPLLPEEQACIRGAVDKRRREFAAGRACARRALEHFGIFDHPLLVGPNRAPVWPESLVGSITHCDGFVGAAVARHRQIRSIGVDAERGDPLEPDLIALICSPREQAWIRATAAPGHTDWPKLFFSAKEAVYKCLAPWCETVLGFHDVELVLQPTVGRFDVHFTREARFHRSQGLAVRGRFATSSTHVFTGVWLTASAPANRRRPSPDHFLDLWQFGNSFRPGHRRYAPRPQV